MIPKYYNREAYDFDKQERTERSSSNTKDWYEALKNEDVMMGKHWKGVCKAFDICSRYNLPFPTYNGLKTLGRNSKLLAKFVIAMWLNEYKDVLLQDIDRFEQFIGFLPKFGRNVLMNFCQVFLKQYSL